MKTYRHPHYDLIVEAIEDTRKQVAFRGKIFKHWKITQLSWMVGDTAGRGEFKILKPGEEIV